MTQSKLRLCQFCGKPGIKPNAKYHAGCTAKVIWAKRAENDMAKERRLKRPKRRCKCGESIVLLEGKTINTESVNEYELRFLKVGSEVSYDPTRHKKHRCKRG